MKQAILCMALAVWTLSSSAQTAKSVSTETAGRYELVSDAATLAAGDKIIIVCCTDGSGNYHRMSLGTTQNTDNRAPAEITKNADNTITISDKTAIIALGGARGAWTFYVTNGDATGYLCAASSSKNSMRTKSEADKNAQAKISIAETGDATITFQGNYTRDKILYNPSSEVFSCYASKTDNTRYPQIYRRISPMADVNKDGSTTVADVTALVEILLGKDDAEPRDYDREAADVNADGAITIADVTALTNLLLRQ